MVKVSEASAASASNGHRYQLALKGFFSGSKLQFEQTGGSNQYRVFLFTPKNPTENNDNSFDITLDADDNNKSCNLLAGYIRSKLTAREEKDFLAQKENPKLTFQKLQLACEMYNALRSASNDPKQQMQNFYDRARELEAGPFLGGEFLPGGRLGDVVLRIRLSVDSSFNRRYQQALKTAANASAIGVGAVLQVRQ